MRRLFHRFHARIRSTAFTLIELLIVLFIMSILAAVALPTVKGLIQDQKGSRAARSISAFFDVARSRAIAEGRYVGVRVERFNSTDFGLATSLQLRQLTGVPAYSGDASNSLATLKGNPISTAEFDAGDCPLLLLSSTYYNDGDDATIPPIQPGDLLELPGGRMVPISGISGTGPIVLSLAMKKTILGGPNTFPSTVRGVRNTAAGDQVKFRIHRRPVPSSSRTLALPRGVAIDLNYSGVGTTGNQFNPVATTDDIDIIFGPTGEVAAVAGGVPVSMVYLCLGATDGIAPAGENLYQNNRQVTTNLMTLDSVWLVINPNSGRIIASPFATVTSVNIPTSAADQQDLGKLGAALEEARFLATQTVILE